MSGSTEGTQSAGPGGNFFPPGLSVRHVATPDNEAVRKLFIDSQAEIVPDGADAETRIALKKYTDSCLMTDLARASSYYSKPGKQMWVLESQEHEIVAMAAIDSESGGPGPASSVALLRRIAVRPEFRRKGVAILLSKRAEQWASKQGFSKMRLFVSELQPGARNLYERLQYSETRSDSYGPIAVFEMEKPLPRPGNLVQAKRE